MSSQMMQQADIPQVHRARRADAEVSDCFADLYRRLFLPPTPQEPLRSVGITSCRRGEGVTTVATRLAIAAAEQGEQVLLVDASSAAPSASSECRIAYRPGEALECVGGRKALDQVLEPSSLETLWMLPLAAFANSFSIETTALIRDVASVLAGEFSLIVVDLPPVDQLCAAAGLKAAIDGFVLVFEADRTDRSMAQAAKDALSSVRVLGAVLNKRQPR